MKKSLYFLILSLISLDSIAGESMGCIWAKAKLETAIKMQKEYEEKQLDYRRANGAATSSAKYEIGLEISKEDEREARAEVLRKCQ